VRKTLPGAFTFEYTLPPPNNTLFPGLSANPYGVYGQQQPPIRDSDDPTAPSGPLPLDVENDLPNMLQFDVGDSDVGGSLVVELGINSLRVRRTRNLVTSGHKRKFSYPACPPRAWR